MGIFPELASNLPKKKKTVKNPTFNPLMPLKSYSDHAVSPPTSKGLGEWQGIPLFFMLLFSAKSG
jgi:hypothetical protein